MKHRSKDIILIILCIFMVLMGVGYALLARDLVIQGYTKISSKLNVVITSIDVTANKTEGTSNKNAYVKTPTAAVFESTLSEPGDYIEYVVTIENKGSINAILDSATFVPEGNEYIEFQRYGNAIDNPALDAGESTTLNIKVIFKNNVNGLPNSFNNTARTELLLNYIENAKK